MGGPRRGLHLAWAGAQNHVSSHGHMSTVRGFSSHGAFVSTLDNCELNFVPLAGLPNAVRFLPQFDLLEETGLPLLGSAPPLSFQMVFSYEPRRRLDTNPNSPERLVHLTHCDEPGTLSKYFWLWSNTRAVAHH
jgi:hypothetical protein